MINNIYFDNKKRDKIYNKKQPQRRRKKKIETLEFITTTQNENYDDFFC